MLKRSDLLEVLKTVAPALATNDKIPLLTHVWFRGSDVIAFNDMIAISTPCETAFVGALPGKLLMSLLSATNAEEFEVTEKGNQIIFNSKDSTFKLAYMSKDVFEELANKIPKTLSKTCIVEADQLEALRAAIALCMLSVRADSSAPERLGITIEPYAYDDGSLTLYATNGETISKNKLRGKPNLNERVIINAEFCQQLVSMKNVEHIEINNEYSLAKGDKVTLYGRVILSERPLNFKDVIASHMPKGDKIWIAYPPEVKNVIERAVAMSSVGNSPKTTITHGNTTITFVTESPAGNIKDELLNTSNHRNQGSFDAKLIRAGLDHYDHWLVTESALIMRHGEEGEAIYMIAGIQD